VAQLVYTFSGGVGWSVSDFEASASCMYREPERRLSGVDGRLPEGPYRARRVSHAL